MRAWINNKFDFKRFFVGEGPVKSPYYLSQRRVYILPTRQGLTFTILLFVMLLGSINYSNSLGYFLTFLLASLFVISIFHTYNNLLRLSIGPAISQPGFARKEVKINISVTNPGKERFSIQTFVNKDNPFVSDLDAKSVSTIAFKTIFQSRGLNPLPRLTIQTTYPLGLFRAWTYVQLDQSVLTYPAPSQDRELPVNLHGMSNGKQADNKGNDDFKNLRTFHPGDPLQHVHWKSYARHQNLLTKEFSGLQSEELWLNWSDTINSDSESRLSQLCRWVILANDTNIAFGLRLPGLEIKPGSGQKHYDFCLKQLALYQYVK